MRFLPARAFRESLVGSLHLLEASLSLGVIWIEIRVISPGEAPVRPADLGLRGARGNTQGLPWVQATHGLVPFPGGPAAGDRPESTGTGSPLWPAGNRRGRGRSFRSSPPRWVQTGCTHHNRSMARSRTAEPGPESEQTRRASRGWRSLPSPRSPHCSAEFASCRSNPQGITSQQAYSGPSRPGHQAYRRSGGSAQEQEGPHCQSVARAPRAPARGAAHDAAALPR